MQDPCVREVDFSKPTLGFRGIQVRSWKPIRARLWGRLKSGGWKPTRIVFWMAQGWLVEVEKWKSQAHQCQILKAWGYIHKLKSWILLQAKILGRIMVRYKQKVKIRSICIYYRSTSDFVRLFVARNCGAFWSRALQSCSRSHLQSLSIVTWFWQSLAVKINLRVLRPPCGMSF